MRKAMLLLVVLGLAGVLWAQSPFDGTWKVDLNKAQFPEKPDVFAIQNGMFICSTCDPKIDVKADGTDQAVKGSREFDTLAVKIVDDRTVQFTRKKSGKIVSSSKESVSADGKSYTVEFTEYPQASKQPVTGKATLIRVAAGPAGSHAISGSWRIQKLNASENALTMTFKSTADGLMMTSPTGESLDAKFDGKDYQIKNAPEGYTVSLKKVNDHTIVMTDKRDGKVVSETTFTVSADGKTFSAKSENKVQGTTTTYSGNKQ